MSRPLDGPRRSPASGRAATSLVIFAHGYGSNGADLIGLAPILAQALPNTAFVSPNARDPVPGAPGGFQWFPITRLDPALMLQGARAAAAALDGFIDDELTRHRLPPSACALVGFSQGTMMSLHVGFRRAQALAAMVGFSGALVGPDDLAIEARSRPPTLLVHGDADEVLPVHALAAARAGLAQARAGCRWMIRPGLGHSLDELGLAVAGSFLVDAFAGRLGGWTGPQDAPN